MTAPGDSLDFHGSPSYRARVSGVPDVDLAIQKALRNRPLAGTLVAGAVREFSLQLGGEKYVVFYTRRGNDIGLVAVFDAADQVNIEAKKTELRALFSKGGKR